MKWSEGYAYIENNSGLITTDIILIWSLELLLFISHNIKYSWEITKQNNV